ncbi:MAG TPA: hypothetical protein VF581_07915 [Flavobacterium sp.]|jgi:CheY-like chemotaxis protein
MNKKGPIILIDDDEDDALLLKEIFEELEVDNEILIFYNGSDAYDYFINTTVQPFLILSDINMPVMSGFGYWIRYLRKSD